MTNALCLPPKFRAIRHIAMMGAALLLLTAQAPPSKSTAIPDTPAGRMLGAWLKAFDSGDGAAVQGFYEQHMPAPLAANAAAFAKLTGGVDLVEVKPIDPLRIQFIAKDRGTPNQGVGVLTLADAGAGRVENFSLRAVPPGTELTGLDIDRATRARVIDAAAAALNESYVDPDVAKRMEADLKARLARGQFERLADGSKFALALMEALRSVSHDKHLAVDFFPARLPPPVQVPPPTPEAIAQRQAQMRASACGFAPAQHLPGNIGLLKFDSFPSPDDICGEAASAAVNSLGDVDAVIFDLRDNHGGDPAMVNYIAGYFFADRTHWSDIWTRKTGVTQEFWTRTDLPGRHYARQPVFILTSAITFSGAEDFSYNMQAHKRAVIVGETTGGGAHPVSGQAIGDGFTLRVPFAKSINPITHTNWEGVGVEPDVKVTATQALATAQKLAAQAPPGK